MFKIFRQHKGFLFPILLLLGFVGCKNSNDIDQKTTSEALWKQIEQTSVTSPDYLPLIDSLYKISVQKNYKIGIAKSFSFKGKYLAAKGLNIDALDQYNEAISISTSANELRQLGDDYYNLGNTFFDLKRREEAIAALKKSAKVREQINDSTGLGLAYNFCGYVYWIVSDYDNAVFYFEKALAIRNKLPNLSHRATTYNNLGTVYYNWSLYDKALDHYLRSLQYQKEQKNNSGVARCLCNIGLVYKETAQNEKAIEYYKESIPYAKASNQVVTIGYAYNCLGTAFSDVNKDSALFYLKKSLDTYLNGKDTVGLALAYQGLGNFYLDINDWKNAKIYFTEMLKIAQSENIPMRIARAYKGLGQANLLADNLLEAKENFEKSVAIGEKSSIKFILRDSYGSLAEIYEKLGKVDKALAALKMHNDYNQQIENEGMQKRLLDLKNKSEYERFQRNLQEQKYENEKQKIYLIGTITAIIFLLGIAVVLYNMNRKRKKVNLLLQEKNRLIEGQSKEISLKNEELLELNEAKEKLFSIIAHDLRSPFHTLINMATLIKEDYATLTDEENIEYLTHLEETAIKTYELVENLLNLSASHTGRINFSPVEIELSGVVEKVINLSRVQSKKKEITLSNGVGEGITVKADQSMLEIIIRNLLNNAIKYSNVGGKVEIGTSQEEDKLCISVKDNGIGMDEMTKGNIFNVNVIRSKNGTNGERGTGLGLGLCKEFVEKHGGTIWVESTIDEGSTFMFTIPSSSKGNVQVSG